MSIENRNHVNFQRNSNFDYVSDQQRPLKPNFSKAELNSVEMPDWIAKEIRHEKYRIFFYSLISGVVSLIALFFILAYFIPKTQMVNGELTKWAIPTNWIPHPAFMFIVLAFGLFIFTMQQINFTHLINSVKAFKGDLLVNRDVLPNFLVEDYRHLVSRNVYTNWICISSYVILGITIGVFFILKAINKHPYHTELITCYVILGVLAFLHIYSLFSIRLRKGNLKSHSNGDIISYQEQREIQKHANKICLVIFLIFISVIFFIIFIPYVIVRKRENKSIIPFR